MTTITKNKKFVIYLFLVVLFIIYMINANTIVAYFTGDAVKKTDIKELPIKDRVAYCIDSYYRSDNLEGRVYFSGWAFCETEKDNSNKEISLLFASDNNCYEFKFKPTIRPDITEAYKKSKKIEGINHGFGGEFSTIPMKNGIYKLFIYDRENKKNYGVADTEKLYKVDSDGFREYTWTSSVNDTDLTNAILGKLEYCIDINSMNEDGSINIQGWAFVNELNSKDQKIYLKITDGSGKTATYDTKPIERIDVGDAYHSSKYNQSGFKALIPTGKFAQGNITVIIYVENNGTIYGPSTNYKFTI